jgi:hypothetical protein
LTAGRAVRVTVAAAEGTRITPAAGLWQRLRRPVGDLPRRPRYLSDVPFLYLVLAVAGGPLAAAAAGWLLAGREPPAIVRRVIE